MNCADVNELAGAIALDAVPEEELTAVRAHLATCANDHGAIYRLLPVADLLLESAPPVEPPAHLRERILAAARAESAQRLASASPAPDVPDQRPTPVPISVAGPVHIAWWRQPARLALAAALAGIALLGAWNVSLQRDLDRSQERAATGEQALAVVAGEGRAVSFAATVQGIGGAVLQPESGAVTLVLQGLARQDGRTYQVWAIRGGQPESLGVFQPDQSGRRVLPLGQSLQGVDAVAITLEPGPDGSRQPTTAPILTAGMREQA